MENKLLYDLEDYVDAVEPDFSLVGDEDIERISSILGQNRYNNIIYFGRSGVGKTANLYGIVQKKKKTINGDISGSDKRLPLHMIDRRFLLLDTNTLFDSNDAQVIEKRIQEVFFELSQPGDHVLIIEDANDLLKGIEDSQSHGLISILVRELKKSSFGCILMVRDEPGQNKLNAVMDCHSDMAELFSVLEKEPPGKERVREILKSSKASIEDHFDGLHIEDEANLEVAKLTFQYPNLKIYIRAQPARALRMRDRIASHFVSRRQSRPQELDALQQDLAAATKRAEAGDQQAAGEMERIQQQVDEVNRVWEERAHALGKAYLERRRHEQGLEELRRELDAETEILRQRLRTELDKTPTERDLNAYKTNEIKEIEKYIRETQRVLEEADEKAKQVKGEHNQNLTLTVADVREFFSELSGIPTKDLNSDEATRALGLEERLKQKVFGQDDAIATIADAVLTAKAGLNNPNAPIGSFIAVGSSGTGKTYSAECLAEELFDDPDALTVFDMSEFMEKHTVARLIGAPPGYAGYGEGGMLTNTVRRRPYQVILLDEIEKAHPDVFKILLQVLDKGRLSDELGTVDFKNTLLIMTTNLAQHFSFDESLTSENSSDDIKKEVRKIFPQELINRVDAFLLYKALSPANIAQILKRLIVGKNKNLKEQKRNIVISLSDEDIDEIVERKYLPEEGARQVQKFVQNNLINEAAKIVLAHSGTSGGGEIHATFDPERDCFEWDFTPLEADAEPIAEAAAS